MCGHCTAGQRQNTEERIPSREAHAVRYRELRVRYTRHWENKVVTQPLEKLLAVSQKSEESARSKCILGNSTVSRACGYLVLAMVWKPLSSSGLVAVGRTVSLCCNPP